MFEGQLRTTAIHFPFSSRKHNTAVFCALAGALFFSSGCENEKPATAPPEVEVIGVLQKDVPITREWVATLTGFVNAQIRAQVSGYVVKQLYTNGAHVKKGAPPVPVGFTHFQSVF